VFDNSNSKSKDDGQEDKKIETSIGKHLELIPVRDQSFDSG